MSIQDLQQNPQDTSNFYLANMYKATIADLNRSNISSSLPAFPPPFSPSTHAVWVNSLWFLSLVISITCALLATLLQQWARRYLKVTRTRSSLHKRARIRSFYVEGVKKSHLSIIVEALPTLIHLSVSLFFAGLVVFLWSVNLTIFKVVLSWIGVCTALYGCITLIPIFRHDSPYRSPLTSLARLVVSVIILVLALLWACFHILATVLCCASCFPNSGPARIFSHLGSWVVRVLSSTQMSPEEAVLKSSSEIDTRAFTWTFDSLDEDHELVRFFSGLPGFHNSRVLKEPLHGLDDRQKLRLLEAAIRLLDRTLSSNLLSVQVRRQRADICANAIDLVVTPGVFPTIVRKLASEDRYGPAQSTEIVDFVRRWDDRKGEDTTLVQAMFSIVVARVQRHDDSWFRLASSELGIPEIVLREYATHGDNLSLAILIYVTRQQFIHIREPSWPSKAISDVLRAASKFNTQDTSPELQHEFCALWNQIVQDAQKGSSNIPEHILGPIRAPYIVLHQGTNSAPTQFSSTTGDDDINLWVRDAYPVCNVSGHIRNDSTSPRCPPIVPHDNAALPPASGSLVSTAVPSFPSPAPSFPSPAPSFPSPAPSFPSPAPSFPSPALPYVYNSLTTMLLDNSHPTGQSIETFHAPVNSPDQPIPGAMPDTVYLSIATPLPTPETSTSTPPHFSTSPPASVSSRHSANILAPPRPPNTPSSVSSNPALDNIHHTGPSLCSHSPINYLITRISYYYSQRFSGFDLYDCSGCYS